MKNICCVCLEYTPLSQKLYTSDNEIDFQKKLQLCIPEINWKKYFYICTQCQVKVNVSYELREVCLKGEQERLRLIKCDFQLENDGLILDDPSINTREFCPNTNSINKHLLQSHNIEKHTEDTAEDNNSTSELNNLIEETKVCSEELFDLDNNLNSLNHTSELKPALIETNNKINVLRKRGRRVKTKFPVKCEYCFREFNRNEHLLSHIRSIHTHEKPYSCDTCGKQFSISQSLLVHKRRHNNEKPYCCTYCGKQFSCSADLYHHNQIHLNKREYKCDTCTKCFNTASILRKHKICAHTDPSQWKYECNYCKRRFPMGGNLKTHLRRHDNEKNFICDICQKAFYDKFILQRHVRTHTNERSFKCKLCEKEYKDNCSLNIHLKKVHDVGNATIPKRSRKFVCHICPKTFTSDDKLQKHINSHTGYKPYKCEQCDKSFSDNWYRKKHAEQKHNSNANHP